MSYRLEVAFNLKQRGDALMLKRELINVAEKYECEFNYEDFEFHGKGRTITRNHLILTFFFPQDPTYIIKFITFLKDQKKVYIESVGFDNCKFTLLYASKKYLNMMNKYKVKEYLSDRKKIDDDDFKRVLLAVQ